MATVEAIEQLRQYALEEQLSAAFEQRKPDRRMLDSLGATVLADSAPVVCYATEAARQFLHPVKGYMRNELDIQGKVALSGRFGGFVIQSTRVCFPDADPVMKNTVNFFVMDTHYDDTGILCPVECTDLVDVVEVLEGDEVFDDIQVTLAQEVVDLTELSGLVGSVVTTDKFHLYDAYISSVLHPHEVYHSFTSNYHILAHGRLDKSLEDFTYNLDVYPSRGDKFSLGRRNGHVTELFFQHGFNPALLIPFKHIIGYEPASTGVS